jgi:hypothetical protein
VISVNGIGIGIEIKHGTETTLHTGSTLGGIQYIIQTKAWKIY